MDDFNGRKLVGRSGDDIGTVTDVIANPIDLEPEWLVVKLGRLAGEHLVPLAAVEGRDDELVGGFGKDDVKSAPRAKDHAAPATGERDELYRHYGLPAPGDTRHSPGTSY